MKNYPLKKLASISFYPLIFVISLWIIFFFQQQSNFNFYKFGVLPRDIKGLAGIVTSVFIHGGLDHLVHNTFPLLVLGSLLFFFYKKIAKVVFLWIWLISGTWLWIGGRNNSDYPVYHIGASTLIYGLATFLFFSGVFRKNLRLMVVSALVVFLYGSIMWGIFPLKNEISWEGHLFGAIAGLLVAFNYRKEGPQRRMYEWEDETDTDEDNNTEEINIEDAASDKIGAVDNEEIKINYIFKNNPSDENNKSA